MKLISTKINSLNKVKMKSTRGSMNVLKSLKLTLKNNCKNVTWKTKYLKKNSLKPVCKGYNNFNKRSPIKNRKKKLMIRVMVRYPRKR
jgi:hypothetical protein